MEAQLKYPWRQENFPQAHLICISEAGIYQVMMTLVDDDGGEAVAEWEVMVGDISPVEAGPDCSVDEGSMFLSAGFLADTDSLTFSAIVDYYDETGAVPLQLNSGNTFDLYHIYGRRWRLHASCNGV